MMQYHNAHNSTLVDLDTAKYVETYLTGDTYNHSELQVAWITPELVRT